MKKPPSVSREAKHRCDMVILSLAACYAELKPGSTTKDFLNDVMDLVRAKDNSSVVDPVEIVMQFFSPEETAKGADWIATQPSGPMLISATFCARARASLNRGLEELTWSNTADAMFWCGVANSRKRIDSLIFKTETQARAEGKANAMTVNGKLGAVARSHAWQPIREFAFQYARRPGANWESRSHAADVIAKATRRFCEEQEALANAKEGQIRVAMQAARDAGKRYQGEKKVARLPPIKTKNFARTVDDWLKDMPDAASLFPPC